ncbi:MAG: 30S ribosome-binding factor RbfA [bacterium]
MVQRAERINQLIKKEISFALEREADFSKGTLVTLTRVDTSANLIQAKVFISVFPEDRTEEILGILQKRVYHFQQLFNKRVKMRPVPKLIFIAEKQTVEAGRIDELLAQIKREHPLDS